MKSYVSEKQIRLVGKAWEVKHQLQQMLQQGGPKVTVADYLAGLYIPHKHNTLRNKHMTHALPFPLANT